MERFGLTAQQLVLMLIYLLLGYELFRFHIITSEGSRDLAALLVKLVIPAIIINSFCVPFAVQKLADLAVSWLLAALLLALAIGIAHILYPHAPLEHFSAAFSNAGFMGIPLVTAVLGSEAVLYAAPFVALLNALQWTYGMDVIREKKTPLSLGRIFWNPPMVGIGVGLILFVTGWGDAMPALLGNALQGICALNTPLAMMILGVYLAKESPRTLFTDKKLYQVCAVRLLLVPVVSTAVLWALPVRRDIALAVLICAAAPVGANVAAYSQLLNKDYVYASKIVVFSTLFSLICLPLIVIIGQMVL